MFFFEKVKGSFLSIGDFTRISSQTVTHFGYGILFLASLGFFGTSERHLSPLTAETTCCSFFQKISDTADVY